MTTARIQYQMQRLADLGTRLRALNDADVPTIEAELAAIEAMDPEDGSFEDFTQAAVESRHHFLSRGHELLRAAKRREVSA